MNPAKPPQLTEEDIIRLARTINRPLPEGFEAEVFAKIDEIERQRLANPTADPAVRPGQEADAKPEPDVEDDIEP